MALEINFIDCIHVEKYHKLVNELEIRIIDFRSVKESTVQFDF